MTTHDYDVFDRSGYTSTIYRIPGTCKVVKSFLPDCVGTHFPVEKEAYERFSAHDHSPSILRYYGVDENDSAGLILELAENRNLYDYVWDAGPRKHDTSPANLYRWAKQASEALAFAHSCGVIHSDIHCVNFVLDSNLDLKVADWAGASIDGGHSYSSYRRTHSLLSVRGKGSKADVQSEMFGFGSAMHNMVAGHDIFAELDYEKDRDEIVRRLKDGQFPDTSEFPVLGDVISKCWKLKFASMQDIWNAIESARKEHENKVVQT